VKKLWKVKDSPECKLSKNMVIWLDNCPRLAARGR